MPAIDTTSGAYHETFAQGYMDCAVWASTDDDGEPLDSVYNVDDIDDDARDSMIADCDAFIDANASDLAACTLDASQAGHDFWLTRNGHGAGYWDRGIGAYGDRLTEAAKVYGDAYLFDTPEGRLVN